MATQEEILDFYANSGKMTSPGSRRVLVDALPNDAGLVARTVQGIAIHEHMAPASGFQIPDERMSGSFGPTRFAGSGPLPNLYCD